MPFLANSSFLWRVWKASTRASMVREMEFRGNFLAGLIRQFLWLGAFVFMIEVIFQNTDSLAGWKRADVLIVLALSRIIESIINSLFAQNIMELPQLVRNGKFDFHLTKPVPAQFYTAFRKTGIDNIGNFIAGLLLLGYAMVIGESLLAPADWVIFALLAIVGIIIYYSLLIIAATLVFVLERLEFLWGFHTLISEPLTVPFDIFPRLPRAALTYLLPIAFVVYVPAQALTGRLAWWQVPTALAIAGLLLTLANLAWRAGLRRYSSASS